MLSICAVVSAAGTAIAFPGPDVIVGELPSISSYGSQLVNGERIWAYSVGTTSCNIGDVPLNWFANTNQHPVIGQNLYRWRLVDGAGQFEQIGGSHLKHGFTALQGTVCFNDCQAHPNGTRLGVHCSDPYSAGLNGNQGGLGPRDQINAYTGNYPYPFASRTPSTGAIARRLQVKDADLNTATPGNPTAWYFVEGHYIAPDDALAGNGANNASYRRATRSGSSTNWQLATTSSTRRQLPAIYGWTEAETGVTIRTVIVPGEEEDFGTLHVGYKVTQMQNGMYHYEYMIHNMNSDRAARAFQVNFPTGGRSSCIDTANVGFRDIAYHSGEPWGSTDWTAIKNDLSQEWVGPAQGETNGNALRWGTSYSFRFNSTRPPVPGTGTIQLFKAGDVNSVNVEIQVPDTCPCPNPDFNGDGSADQADVACIIATVAGDSACTTNDADLNQDGSADQGDVAYLISLVAGGPCE